MIYLRQACEDDCQLIWEWANDPDVRQLSFSSDFIPWEEHLQWFAKKLSDPNCFQFIALDSNNTPIGQIRFDIHEKNAEVAVSLDKGKRQQGYGSILIRKGVVNLIRLTQINNIHAFIRAENKASIRVFQKAGFVYQNTEIVKGNVSVLLVWKSNGE